MKYFYLSLLFTKYTVELAFISSNICIKRNAEKNTVEVSKHDVVGVVRTNLLSLIIIDYLDSEEILRDSMKYI